MPNLKALTTVQRSETFLFPRNITLKSDTTGIENDTQICQDSPM